jgi:hypothetical protein
LTAWGTGYGTKFFTLAFVNGSGCQWSLPNQSGWQSQISALRAEGGDVSISFGGYTVDSDGSGLDAQCSSPSAMAAQVESVVTTLGVTHLDFDIESSGETNSTDITRTAQALALVRSWASSNGDNLTIDYTLPVLPTGLTSDGTNVLSVAKPNGFTPNVVNIMTMDYGSSGTEMGTAANQALDATAGQLEGIYGASRCCRSGLRAGTTAAARTRDPRRPRAAGSASPTAPSPRRSSRSPQVVAAVPRHRLRLRQRGLLQRRQLDRQPVELRRGSRRVFRGLEQRRSLLT